MSDDIKRMNYFIGEFLEAEDFQDEQKYHIDMRRRLNSSFRGPGILDDSLKVEILEAGELVKIIVNAGIALDKSGRELVVTSPITKEISKSELERLKNKTVSVFLSYKEEQSDNKKAAGDPTSGFTRWTEKPEIIAQDSTIQLDANNDYVYLGCFKIDSDGKFSQFDRSVRQLSNLTVSGKVGIGTPFPQQSLSVQGGLNVDQAGANIGTLQPGITFGSNSGEGIASKRTAGDNQNGLDFYTSGSARLSISHEGDVTIGAKLNVAGAVQSTSQNVFSTTYSNYALSFINDGTAISAKLNITGDLQISDQPYELLRIENEHRSGDGKKRLKIGMGDLLFYSDTQTRREFIQSHGDALEINSHKDNNVDKNHDWKYVAISGNALNVYAEQGSQKDEYGHYIGDISLSADNTIKIEAKNGVNINTAQKVSASFDVGANPIRFSSVWTGSPDAVTNRAEISNDTGTYKALMIVGNNSAGLGRRVSVWDRLEVNGTFLVNGFMSTNGNVDVSANPLRLSSVYTGFTDPNVGNRAEISNDTGTYKSLMILGNRAGGAERRVSIWDNLNVLGKFFVNGSQIQGSSRSKKQNILSLSSEIAERILFSLEPVSFYFISDPLKLQCLGFIAEDTPVEVSTPEKDAIMYNHITAALTRVVKDQGEAIRELREQLMSLVAAKSK